MEKTTQKPDVHIFFSSYSHISEVKAYQLFPCLKNIIDFGVFNFGIFYLVRKKPLKDLTPDQN